MPTPYIKKLANKHHTTVGKSEGKWDQAKQRAKKQGQSGNYAYITSIYKKMMHESDFTGSFKDFLQITERHLDDESYDRGERGDRFEFDSNEEFGDNQDNPFDDSDEGEFDNWEEGDSESPTDFDDDRFEDNDFDNDHDDHRLSDILNPDELEDREGDEFDNDGHPRNDEDFDNEHTDLNDADELDVELDYEGADDREGSIDDELDLDFDTRHESIEHTHSFSMLSELMQLTEKKKPLKKVAKAVYHRDYQRTKNKPYRKYHPESKYVGKD